MGRFRDGLLVSTLGLGVETSDGPLAWARTGIDNPSTIRAEIVAIPIFEGRRRAFLLIACPPLSVCLAGGLGPPRQVLAQGDRSTRRASAAAKRRPLPIGRL